MSLNLFAARSASIFIHCRARGGEWCSFLVVGGSVKPWGWSGGLPKWRKILPRNKRLQKRGPARSADHLERVAGISGMQGASAAQPGPAPW